MALKICVLALLSLLAVSLALETCKIAPPTPGPSPGPPSGPPSNQSNGTNGSSGGGGRGGGGSQVPYSFNESFYVIELPASTGARCLDGTNYKFKFWPGSGKGAKKFIFSWEGGAFCGIDGYDTLESCYLRSKTMLGSSKFLESNGTLVTSHDAMGFFSSMEKYNPDFWNWNKVLISYCDGSNHQGHLDEPIKFNGTDLYFRGYDNTMGLINYLKTHHSLLSASEIILSGGSAGGQATYFWSLYLPTILPSSIRFLSIPDAGMFLDVYNYQTECHLFRYLNNKIANITKSKYLDLFKPCRYYGTDDVWKCMIAEYIVDDIQTKMFIVNSQDDIEAMRTQYGLTCVSPNPNNCNSTEKARIAAFRAKLLGIAMKLKNSKRGWGFYLRTCFEHVYEGGWAWYGHTNDVYNSDLGKWGNLKEAISKWYHWSPANYIDIKDWEHNPYCVYNSTTR